MSTIFTENLPTKVSIEIRKFFYSLTLLLFLPLTSLFAQLPDDFQKVDILTGLTNSVTMEFSPDGRIFLLDRFGEIKIYKLDTQTVVTAGNLAVFHELEDGLNGIAFDPDFLNNNYIYLFYSPMPVEANINRVSRFTMNGDVLDLSSEVEIINWATQREDYYHSGGDLDFDSEGNLYIATGDNSNHSDYARLDENDSKQSAEKSASNTNDLRGKILRITPQLNGTYTIPNGNLFPQGTPNTRPEIYVMGARNPYRIFVDKENTDWLFWGEVGPDGNIPDPSTGDTEGRDEINLVKEAGNYGWPYFAADNIPYTITYANPPYQNDPLAPQNNSVWNTGLQTLPEAKPSWLDFFHMSYMAGPRYYHDTQNPDQQRLPAEFDGVFFYWDFNSSRIWGVTMDATGNIIQNEQIAPSVFPTSSDGFLDMEIGPDGHMYILAYGAGCCPQNVGTGRLIRVDYTGLVSNAAPIVELSATPNNGSLPLTVDFTADGTIDLDGDTLTYEWDFDTTVASVDATGISVSNTYTQAGTFNAQLRVSDGTTVSTKNITIYAGNNAAEVTFQSPVDGGFMDWGDDVSATVFVSDVEDGDTSNGGGIDCTDLNIVPSFGHLNHFHDGSTINDCQADISLATDHNIQGQDNIFIVLGANYTDTGGLTSFSQIRLHPKRKEAEFYDAENDTELVANTNPWDGGNSSVRGNNESYIVYEGRNLQNIASVKFNIASLSNGSSIEIRSGSPLGALIASAPIPNTGSLSTWEDVITSVTNPTGKNDLYVVFKNTTNTQNVFDLNYVEFIGDGVSTDNSPPTVETVEAISSMELTIVFDEVVTAATAENIANYAIDNGIQINMASLQPDNRTVSLMVNMATMIMPDTLYELTISNVENTAGLPVSTDSFSFSTFGAIRVNAGGDVFTDGNGNSFLGDEYSSFGDVYFPDPNMEIAGTDDDELYRSERYGNNLFYRIPAPEPGEYDVKLHFAELFFGIGNNSDGAGARVFDVFIEGTKVLENFDILAEVDPATALIKEFRNIQVNDGFLNITFDDIVNSPKISAIEFLKAGNLPTNADITILSPNDGWDVNQPFDVSFAVENWMIGEMGSGMTHVHYIIDNDPATLAPHYSYDPIEIDGLSLGEHTIRVELYNADHTGTGIFDEVTVNVTNQQVCNDTDFPDQWEVRYLEDQNTELDWRAVYILPHDDLDGDGLKDIVTGAWWYKNPGTASGNWVKNTIGAPFNNVAYVYDFDGDGDMDLLGTQGAYEGSDMAWAENDGAGNFTVRTNIPSGDEDYTEPFLAGIAPGPFDNSGLFQMAINWNGAESTGNIEVQMLTVPADPVNTVWSFVNIGVDSAGEDIRSGDIDGDGDLDLFQGVNWLRNEGNGNWTEFNTGIDYVTTPDRSQLADFDGDGRLDAVVGQLTAGGGSDPARFEFSWFKAPADPTQLWERNVLATDIEGSLSVYATDIDFDGDQDIVVGEWLGQHRLITFENDLCASGTWIRQTLDNGGTGIDHHDSAQVTDIDNDGDLDVVSVGWNTRVARIYENTTIIADPVDNIEPVVINPSLQLYNENSLVDLQIIATDENVEDTLMYMASGLPDGLAMDMTTGLITGTLTAVAGEYEVTVTVTDPTSLSDTVVFTMAVGEFNSILRINAGGPEVLFNTENWIADEYFVAGDIFEGTNRPIDNSLNDEIFLTERNSGANETELIYNIPVPENGVYGVKLYFAEIFHNLSGERIFNVDLENGEGQLTNYDILAVAGSNTAVSESFLVDVQDGMLTIVFTDVVDRAKISGIELLGSIEDAPPVVNAGEDQQLLAPNTSITLSGTAYDPDGGDVVSFLWEQIQGPNQATLTNQDQESFTASGLIIGSYIFRLNATDDEGASNFDEITLSVDEPLSEAILINAGGPSFTFNTEDWNADQYFGGGEVFDATDAIENTDNDILYQTERYSTSGTLVYEIPLLPGEYSVNLHFAEIFFGVGSNPGGLGSRIFNIDIEDSQAGEINYDIIERAGDPATAIVESYSNISVVDGNLTITLTSVVGDPKISGISISQIPNSIPTVSVGEDLELILPENNTVITGVASDTDGTIDTFTWTQESGPSNATLVGESTTEVTVSDLVEGVYVFRLSVTDNEGGTALDEVSVTVLPEPVGNVPVVSVGEDIELTLPENNTVITGVASDTDGTIDTFTWTQESGPSTATLVGESTTEVTVSDLVEGVYVFRLSVTDNEGETAFDEVMVTVLPAPIGNIPVVSVGEDIELTLPENSTVITGVASDTDGTIEMFLWTQESGPSTSTLVGESTTEVTVSDLEEGVYVFRLSITDNDGDMAFDEVTVTVSSAMISNEAPVAIASASVLEGLAPLEITFTGSSSTDDNEVVSYLWDFSNGDTSVEADLVYIFEEAGTFSITLTVTDAEGLTDITNLEIIITENDVTEVGSMKAIAFPNPANEATTVSIENQDAEILWIRLHDSTGKMIQNYNPEVVMVNGGYELPLPSLRNGIYYIVVETSDGVPFHLNLLIRN